MISIKRRTYLTTILLIFLTIGISFTATNEKLSIKIDNEVVDFTGVVQDSIVYIPVSNLLDIYGFDFYSTENLSFADYNRDSYFFMADREYYHKNLVKVYYDENLKIKSFKQNNKLYVPANMLNKIFSHKAFTLKNNTIHLITKNPDYVDLGYSQQINNYLNREQDMSKVKESMVNDWGKAEFKYFIKEIKTEKDKKILDLEYDLGEYTYDRYLPNPNQWHYGAEELSDEVDNYIISNIGKFRTRDGSGIDFFTESTRGNNGVFLHKLATQSDSLRRDMHRLIKEPQEILGEENIQTLKKGDYPTTKIYSGGYGSGVSFTVFNPNSTKKEGYDNDLQIQWSGFGFENFIYMRAVFKQYFGIEEGERAYQILVNSYLKGDEYKDLEKFNFKKVYRFSDRNLAIVPNESSRSGGIYFLISNPGNFNYIDYINKHGMKWGY